MQLLTPNNNNINLQESDECKAKNKLQMQSSHIYQGQMAQKSDRKIFKQIINCMTIIIIGFILKGLIGTIIDQSSKINLLEKENDQLNRNQQKLNSQSSQSEIQNIKEQNNQLKNINDNIIRDRDLLQKRVGLLEDDLKNFKNKLNKDIDFKKSLCEVVESKCMKQGSIHLQYKFLWVCHPDEEILYNNVCNQQDN